MTHPTIDATWYEKPAGIPEVVSAGGVIVRRAGDQVRVALVREGTLPAYVLPPLFWPEQQALLQTHSARLRSVVGL